MRHDDALAAPIAVPESSVAETATTEPEPPTAPAPRRRRRLALGGVLALLAAAGVVAAVLVLRDDAPVVVPPNSVAVIDADTNRVESSSIPVGIRPGPVAAGAGFVWVGNLDDRSLSRIDPATNEQGAIRLEVTPDAVAADGAAAWVVDGRLGTLYRVEAESPIVSDAIRVWQRSFGFQGAGVDVGKGSVWTAGGGAMLARWDPATLAGDASS